LAQRRSHKTGGLFLMTTFTWIPNGTNGYWSTQNRWLPAGPPTAGSDVVIAADSLDGNTVFYNVGTLAINTLSVNGASFNVISGALSVANGSSFGSPLTINVTVSGGLLTLAGGATFNSNLTISGTGQLGLAAGSSNTVSGLLTDTLGGVGSLSLGAGASLAGNGKGSARASTLTLGSGAPVTFNSDFTPGGGTTGGTGTFVLTHHTLSLPLSVTISGAFQQNGGPLGSTVAGPGWLTVKGAASFMGTNLQTGAGTTDLKGATTVDDYLGVYGGRVLQNDG